MSKWKWAFGSVPVFPKFRWAVNAGDQEPQSPDDKKCGDHYIDKNLECHDGDAHRPDPGNNPYWQGGRKGPPSEDEGGKGKSERGERDRREITKKAKTKEEKRQESGEGFTPERAADWATDRLGEYMEETETAHRDTGGIDWDSAYGEKKLHELAEKTIRDTAREYAGHLDTRSEKGYLPHREGHEERPDPGVEHRDMSRDRGRPITFEEPEHGTPVHVPFSPGESVFRDLIDRARGRDKPEEKKEMPRKEEPSETEDDAAKWDDPETKFTGKETAPKEEGDMPFDYQEKYVEDLEDDLGKSPEELDEVLKHHRRAQTRKEYKRRKDAKKKAEREKGGEASLAAGLNWSGAKIMMDRTDDNPDPKGCPPDESKLLALESALPPLPGDSATSRPCGDGEDPKKGHCNPDLPPEQRPDGLQPASDAPKALHKMGDKRPTPPKGVGLDPAPDPQRAQRTAQNVALLKNSDPKDTKRTAWAVGKMFGGIAAKPTKNGVGASTPPMSQEQATMQYDDARHSMQQAGWQNTSDVGGRSTWSKGGSNISMQTGPDGTGQFANQYTIHTPKKRGGLFRR